MNLLTILYSIRNRFLRHGKRYQRKYHPLFQSKLLSLYGHDSWSKCSKLTTVISMILSLTLIWCFLLQTSNRGHETSSSPTTTTTGSVQKAWKSFQNSFFASDHHPNHNRYSNSDSQHHRPTPPVKRKVSFQNFHVKSSDTGESRLGMIYNQTDRLKKESGFRLYAFNSLVSERLGFSPRSLPDTRHELCPRKYAVDQTNHSSSSSLLLTTTVIICFYNEELHALIRTINSLLLRTSAIILQEILLIDDFSDNNVQPKIHQYNQSLRSSSQQDSVLGKLWHKVHYRRVPERSGLIRARNYGAQFAQGQVLFFLDSHCEVNVGWLEPLLDRIGKDRRTVACPMIDLIDPDTFFYKPSPMVRGGFNWALHFKWDSIPSEELATGQDFVRPIKSPAMAGGLFAIDRRYFFQLGQYDPGMNIWGGENIEFSLRIWMCGGRLEIVPCSRVGHIFRKRRPYDSPDGQDTLAYNSLRVAHVWLDDYKKHFLESRRDLAQTPYGNIDDRLRLRKSLNCKTFEWYLREIYPQLSLSLLSKDSQKPDSKSVPKKLNLFEHRKPVKFVDKFLIQLNGTRLCLESPTELSYKTVPLHLGECSANIRRQLWKMTELNELRMGLKGCLEAGQNKLTVQLAKCHQMGSTQRWSYNRSKIETKLYNHGSGTCLAANNSSSTILTISESGENLRAKKNHRQTNANQNVHMTYCLLTPSTQNVGVEQDDSAKTMMMMMNNVWNLISPKTKHQKTKT